MGESQMSYKVMIVSRLDFAYRQMLEHEGGIRPADILEATSVDEAVATLDDLVGEGSGIGAIIYYLDINKDRIVQFRRLMAQVNANHPAVPVIVTSIYDSAQSVEEQDGTVKLHRVEDKGGTVRWQRMSVADAFIREGAYTHLDVTAKPQVLVGWVKSAQLEHRNRLNQGVRYD